MSFGVASRSAFVLSTRPALSRDGSDGRTRKASNGTKRKQWSAPGMRPVQWSGDVLVPIEPPACVSPVPAALDPHSSRVTIADAIAAFLVIPEGIKIAPSTLRKYRTFTNHVRKFADSKGYVMLDQFTSADMDVFYSHWKLGARAKGKALGTLRSFFRFCMNRESLHQWLQVRKLAAGY